MQQEKKNILVVEDDQSMREMVIHVLQEEDLYRVQWAVDAFQAQKIRQTFKPDLLLTNYHLPDMNGIELYDSLIAQDGNDPIPTIIMSATLPAKEIRKRWLYQISIPFDIFHLLDLVEEILSK